MSQNLSSDDGKEGERRKGKEGEAPLEENPPEEPWLLCESYRLRLDGLPNT